jgi:short-subunit dehydrogenase
MSKTIAIIGAGPGVGLAVARRFGKEGFRVALLARNEEKLAEMVNQLTDQGIESAAFQADVMDTGGLSAALRDVIAHFGSIDVLEYGPVSGMGKMRTVLETDMEAASYQFAYNVLGAIAAVQTALPGMQTRKDGAILFTTAVSAQHPVNMTASFGISAGAQLNYARLLHDNLKSDGIYTGIVSIAALVTSEDPASAAIAANFPAGLPIISADEVAEKHWELYTKRDSCEAFVGNVDAILGVFKR